MLNMWYEISCPECDKINWVFNGDMNDLTRPDVTGVKCFSCSYEFPLDEEMAEILPGNWQDYIENGQEKPD